MSSASVMTSTVQRPRYIDNLDRINIDQVNMTNGRISAAEAATRLGVKRETIYAYVSRGMLTSERHLDGKSSTFDPAEHMMVRSPASHSS